MNATSDRLVGPLGSGGSPGRPTSTNRVTASGLSSMSSASTASRSARRRSGRRRPRRSSAVPSARPAAAAAVDSAGTTTASGRRSPANAALGLGVRVGGRPGVRRAAPCPARHQRERHRQQHLAGDHQRVAAGELVEGRRDRALDGVLDRHHRAVGLAAADRVQRGGDRRAAAAGRLGSRPGWCAAPPRRRCPRGRGRRSGRVALQACVDPSAGLSGSRLTSASRWPAAPRARGCASLVQPDERLGVGAGLGPRR